MAYRSWKDIADITFNSTDLKAFVKGVSGLKFSNVPQAFRAAGSAFEAQLDTGLTQHDPVVIDFMYDGGASGPNVKCARGTSATLTLTFYSGESITGTFWVSDVEVQAQDGQDNSLQVTFQPSATAPTWDLAT